MSRTAAPTLLEEIQLITRIGLQRKLSFPNAHRTSALMRLAVHSGDVTHLPLGPRRWRPDPVAVPAAIWSIHIQGQVRPPGVIKIGVSRDKAAEMPFAKHDYVVQAFSPNPPDHPLRIRILPRTPWDRKYLRHARTCPSGKPILPSASKCPSFIVVMEPTPLPGPRRRHRARVAAPGVRLAHPWSTIGASASADNAQRTAPGRGDSDPR